jgi:putative NADPH-quinone reductase
LPAGKLKGKHGIVINTSNTDRLREESYFGDPLESIWIKCVFGFCGIEKYYRRNFSIVADSDYPGRKMWLSETEKIVENAVNEGKS